MSQQVRASLVVERTYRARVPSAQRNACSVPAADAV
jgi:hypothetical protein